jgi:hypothetical protein
MAIIVIAIFYTAELSLLALAGLGILGLAIVNLCDVRKPSLVPAKAGTQSARENVRRQDKLPLQCESHLSVVRITVTS